MAGIQITGLVSGLNWQNIISELITADSAGVNQVKAQQTTVNNQVTALGSIGTDLTSLENSVFTLEDPGTYGAVTAGSTDSTSTWQVSATNGTPVGNTILQVNTLATASELTGASNIALPLSSSGNVSSLTVANLGVAQPVTAGVFSVNGAQVTVTTSESLQDVFSAIATATGGNVTAAYDPSTDKITLTSASGNVVLGAANDTSNFLSAMNLTNTGASTSTSTAALGALKTGVPLASAGLVAPLTGLDSSGNGSILVNGVTINYNANTDSLSTLLTNINNSSAGVTASYDSDNNRILLTDNATGDTGISVSDASGGSLAAALGLTATAGGVLNFGANASFNVNGGPTVTSTSNAFTSAQLGVPGLSITATTTGTQNIAVVTDTTGMQTAIQSFITAFNQVQTDITNNTNIGTNASGSVTTSLLSADHEVGDWGSQLEMTAFSAGDGVSGAITSLDALGIDFTGTTGQLSISDSAKLQQALSAQPAAVAAFFQTASTGFGATMNGAINDILTQNKAEVSNLQSESTDLGTQITTMQTQLATEQQTLETEFTAMESLEAQYQTEQSTLSSLYANSGSSTTASNASAANSAASTIASQTGGTSTSGSTSTTGSTTSSSTG